MNYFHAHKFRSRAVIEFGDPIEIPPGLVDNFKDGKRRESIGSLLGGITQSLAAVTMSAPDFDTLMVSLPSPVSSEYCYLISCSLFMPHDDCTLRDNMSPSLQSSRSIDASSKATPSTNLIQGSRRSPHRSKTTPTSFNFSAFAIIKSSTRHSLSYESFHLWSTVSES